MEKPNNKLSDFNHQLKSTACRFISKDYDKKALA